MKKINLGIKEQKKDECAIECLSSVLNYLGEENIDSEKLIKEVGKLEWKWRNWDYEICSLALKKGYKATVITLSTQIFDPTWFNLKNNKLIAKLKKEKTEIKKLLNKKPKNKEFFASRKPNYELVEIDTIIKFLSKGGKIIFKTITKELIESYLKRNIPIFFPHNSTLLHKKIRMLNKKGNDLTGHAWGHVSLIIGYSKNSFYIADPTTWNNKKHYYAKNKNLVIESILRNDQNIFLIYK